MPGPANALDVDLVDEDDYVDDPTIAIGLDTNADSDADVRVEESVSTNGAAPEVDPAEVMDTEQPIDVDPGVVGDLADDSASDAEQLPTSDATSPIPAGLFRRRDGEGGAHSSEPPPPTLDESLEQPAPETIVVDGLSLEVASPKQSPAEPSRSPAETGPVFGEPTAPTPEIVVPDVPMAAPAVMDVPTVVPGAPPTEADPATTPPPPAVGDPVQHASAAPSSNGVDLTGAIPGITVASRSEVAGRAGDFVAKVPKLLDEGLLKRTNRLRSRKVRRVVRHVDPWSVLAFSVLFFLCLFAALLLASVLVWNAAVAAGTIENIESFIREIGDYQTYEINGDVVFKAAMVIAGILTLAASVMLVLLVVVFNLISDLVGGIRVTVVEEETIRVRRQNQ